MGTSVRIKRSIKLEQIWIQVTCPKCERTFNVRARSNNPGQGYFTKHCNCGEAEFFFNVENVKDRVVIHAAVDTGRQTSFENAEEYRLVSADISIDDD